MKCGRQKHQTQYQNIKVGNDGMEKAIMIVQSRRPTLRTKSKCPAKSFYLHDYGACSFDLKKRFGLRLLC